MISTDLEHKSVRTRLAYQGSNSTRAEFRRQGTILNSQWSVLECLGPLESSGKVRSKLAFKYSKDHMFFLSRLPFESCPFQALGSLILYSYSCCLISLCCAYLYCNCKHISSKEIKNPSLYSLQTLSSLSLSCSTDSSSLILCSYSVLLCSSFSFMVSEL